MNCSRRDLGLLLPLASGVRAETKAAPVLAASKVYHDRDVAWQGDDTEKGREFLTGATHGGFRVQVHETSLGAGVTTHAPHKHLHEEVIVLVEGSLESYVDGKTENVEVGSVLWLASSQMHSVRNVGSAACRYYVIELRGEE